MPEFSELCAISTWRPEKPLHLFSFPECCGDLEESRLIETPRLFHENQGQQNEDQTSGAGSAASAVPSVTYPGCISVGDETAREGDGRQEGHGVSLMPRAAKRPCAVRSCPELTEQRYCEKHEREHWARLHQQDNRPCAAVRGYDARWNRLQKMYAKAYPLCEECLMVGKTTALDVVHHIKSVERHPELRLAWDNLRSLCRFHHDRAHGYDG